MQQRYQQKPPNIATSLNKAFLQKQNTLIIHSKGVDVLKALANSLYLQKNHLTILVDFQQSQIQQLNYYLQQIKQERLILKDDIRMDKPELVSLNKVLREKRKKCYISGGIYTLSTQIILLDCLSDTEDLNPRYVSRLILKDSDYIINSKFSLLSWLTTLMSLQGNKTIITLISKSAQQFRGQNLQKIMRLLYIKKLVLWPFGRSQIHQALSERSLINRNHKLNFNSTQNQLHSDLLQLLKYTEKSPNDKKQVQYMCYCLLNYNKLDYLVRLQDVAVNSGQYSIWKSSSTTVIQLIDTIINKTRKCIYNMLLIKQHSQQIPQQNKYIPKPTQQVQQQQQASKQQQQGGQHNKNQIQLSQKKGRTIDLNKLIIIHEGIIKKQFPTQPISQKTQSIVTQQNKPSISSSLDNMNPLLYNIQYQLHIPGLSNLSLQQSPLFPIKLLQIIRQIRSNCNHIPPKQYRMDQQQIHMQSMLILNKQNKQQPISTTRRQYNNSPTNKLQPQPIQPQPIQPKPIDNHNVYNQMVVCICTNSKQINKLIHFYLFCYRYQFHYIGYIRKLCAYLQLKIEERVNAIKRIGKRYTNTHTNPSTNTKSNKPLITQQQPILLQQLYLELRTVNQLIQRYSILRHDTVQADYLFSKQIDRLELRYVNKAGLKLWNHDYGVLDDSVICFGVRNQYKVRFCLHPNTNLAELNQNLRIMAPQHIFFYNPNTSYIRHLNIAYSQHYLFGLQQLHTIYFNNSFQAQKVVKTVKQQDEAFWNIAQQRKKLGQYIQSAQIRIKQLIIDDQIQKRAKMVSMAAATQAKVSQHASQIRHLSNSSFAKVQRIVLVDKRQFKSLLPSYLFHHGFKVIPVFLQNADYILSNDVAIEKKSVHTRDLHQSLKSGRLTEQVKRMCAKFSKPYLLIQCPDSSYFKRQQFNYGYSRATGDKYSLNIRKQLVQLLFKYPKLNIIWSTSYMESIKHFIMLKSNKQQPDIGKFKPQSQENQLQALEQQDSQNQNKFDKDDILL